jgi:diaminopimelate epimerase
VRFEKWQALGNDYVIVEARELAGAAGAASETPGAAKAAGAASETPGAASETHGGASETSGAASDPVDRARGPTGEADGVKDVAPIPDLVRALCDRHRGIGADGVLVLAPAEAPGVVARLRVFNPDGSEAEISGNGARQAILYLRRAGWSTAPQLSIETAAGEIRATILSATSARVDMGLARLGPTGEAGGFAFRHLTIGNPQTTIAMPTPSAVDALDLAAVGPPIESDPRFPGRTNVSWYAEAEPGVIRARIFERGVGETESSGTGACGAAVGYVLGHGDSPVTVRLDGGELEVAVGEDLRVELTGWAVPVFTGEIEL